MDGYYGVMSDHSFRLDARRVPQFLAGGGCHWVIWLVGSTWQWSVGVKLGNGMLGRRAWLWWYNIIGI